MAGRLLASVGIRSLRVSAGTWVSLALVLAVGIGANLAVLSVLSNAFEGSQPYLEPDRLVVLENTGAYHLGVPGGRAFDLPGISGPDYRDVEMRQQVFSATGGMTSAEKVIADTGHRVSSTWRLAVTVGLMHALGVRPILGRVLDERDFRPGAPMVALVTHGFWRNRLGGDPRAIGSTLRVDGEPFAVAGVIADEVVGFLRQRKGLFDEDDSTGHIVVPFAPGTGGRSAIALARRSENRDSPLLTVVGRLRSGVSLRTAQDHLATIGHRLAHEHPDTNTGRALAAFQLREWRNPQLAQLRPMLLAVALLTLLVACASAVNLVAADAVRRGPEIAIRWALGATPGRLTRLLLLRSILWTLPAAVLALVVAALTLLWIDVSGGASTSAVLRLPLGPRLLATTLALTLLTGLALGVASRSMLRYRTIACNLAEATQGTSPGRRRRFVLSGLLAVQVASAISLGFVAGLLVRSMTNIAGVNLGYDLGPTFIVPLGFSVDDYPRSREQAVFFDRALARVRALPGILRAGVSGAPPLSNMIVTAGGALAFEMPGRPPESLGPIFVQFVSPGYLEAVGARVVRGRLLGDADHRGKAPVAVIDEAFWHARGAGGDPLQAGIRYGAPLLQVVGVVSNMQVLGPTERTVPMVYVPLGQRSTALRYAFLVVRPSGRPSDAMGAVVRELVNTDRRVCIDEPRTLESLFAGKVATRQRTMHLLTLAAAVALLLTVVSLAGSLGQFVENQKREIAIRKALGASWSCTALLLARHAGVPCLVGLVAGCAGGWSLARAVSSQLFGVRAADPSTMVATGIGLMLFAFLAAALPLWRAARIDPAAALRAL